MMMMMMMMMMMKHWHKRLPSKFKVDRLQIIVVAKKYIYVSQLFISRMPKMRAIQQLVSAPLYPIYQLQNILGGATHCVRTFADNTYK